MRLVLLEPFVEDAQALERLLACERAFQVVAVATEAKKLDELIALHRPQLVLVALSFLRVGRARLDVAGLVRQHRVRLVLLTDEVESATPTAKEEAARALVEGALEVVFRPPPSSHLGERQRREFLGRLALLGEGQAAPQLMPVSRVSSAPLRQIEVLGVVASAGGPAALAQLLREPLPLPVLVAQHIAPGFVSGFAQTLREVTGREVLVGKAGEKVEKGKVYLAPDGKDLGLSPDLRLRIDRRNPRSPHPSGDALLEDLAQLGPGAVAAVLTGMGEDGLLGARKLKASGGRVLIQSRQSSLVFGMPGAIAAEGLADAELAPAEIGSKVREWLGKAS